MIMGFGTLAFGDQRMNQRFLMWGLTSIAFLVTLAISSWNEGLWVPDETPTQHTVRTASFVEDEAPTALPARPFAPLHTAQSTPVETIAAATPPPAPAPPEQEAPAQEQPPPMPVAEQEMDTNEFLAHRDRAFQRGSRAR